MRQLPARLSGSESSFELANRVLFLDREPVSSAAVGAGVTIQLQHLSLCVVRAAASFLDGSFKLDSALDTA
jgi:hypothetical protein